MQVISGFHQSPGELLCDICDGTICSTDDVIRQDDQALQLIAYYDEFTLANPLMSRAKKCKIGNRCCMPPSYANYAATCLTLGAVYFTLANIDPALRSKLDVINLVALFKSDLLSEYSLKDILKPFIDDLKKLCDVCL